MAPTDAEKASSEAESLRKREEAKAYLEKNSCGPSALEMGGGSFLKEGGLGGTDNTLARALARTLSL